MADTVETTEVAKIGIRLTEETYAAWTDAEDDSAQFLCAWFDRPVHNDERYYAYLAALDREEAAALDLQRLAEVAEVCRDVLTDPSSRADDRSATP